MQRAPLIFSCPQCKRKMKAVPPSALFSVDCPQCAHNFKVTVPPLPPTGAPEPPADEIGDANVADGASAPTDVFAEYVTSLTMPGVLPHPADIVESRSLAATPVPPVQYRTVFEHEGGPLHAVLTCGKLSGLQLETVALCGARHARLLPDGRRAGFFLGDGAGVGKGRQIAGVILDNQCRGRKKHLWFSTSTDLRLDAERDLSDLGAPGIAVHDGCQQLDRETRGLGLGAAFTEGVIFSTYASLVSAARVAKGTGVSRLQQLVDWCGGDKFEGCVVFDECHKAKNYKEGGGGGGGGGNEEAEAKGGKKGKAEAGGSKVASAVLELQKRLPNGRVLYASATGVSEPEHLAYMDRLGLWGKESQFGGDFAQFLESLEQRGVGALELLALDMKAGGMYLARSLAFKGAEFELQPIRLSQAQRNVYDGVCSFWARATREIKEAKAKLAEEGGAAAPAGGGSDKGGGGWGMQLRLFQQLCVASKIPQVVALTRRALSEGRSVVIGLQTTGESALHAELSRNLAMQHLPSSCREMLRRHVEAHFQTEVDGSALAKRKAALSDGMTQVLDAILKLKRAAAGTDPAEMATQLGALNARHAHMATELELVERQLVVASNGPCADCVVGKARLLSDLKELPLPPSALDWLIDELGGPSAVAEMTGRKGRMVRSRARPGQAREDAPFEYALRMPSDAVGSATQEGALAAGGGTAGAPVAGEAEKGGSGSGAAEPAGFAGCASGIDETDQLNVLERKAFCDGRKLIAIISDAASTGISLHADRRSLNQRRRVHITLELPWSADKAVQQLGRSHRSNQTSAPVYVLAQAELGGEARFASAVAKRLAMLGALTRGDRRAASGADLSAFNFDTAWGKKALASMLSSVASGTMADIDYAALAKAHAEAQHLGGDGPAEEVPMKSTELLAALRLAIEDMGMVEEGPGGSGGGGGEGAGGSSGKAKSSSTVKQFLNRLLGLRVREQQLVFSTFTATLDATIASAIKDGKYDTGVGDILATSICKRSDEEILADPTTQARTRLLTVAIDRGVDWETILLRHRQAQGTKPCVAPAAQPGGEAEAGAPAAEGSAAAAGEGEHQSEHESGDESLDEVDEAEGEAAEAEEAARVERNRRFDGFYLSRFLFHNRHRLVLLATALQGSSRKFLIARPNTGQARTTIDRDELLAKYRRVDPEEAGEVWGTLHALTVDMESSTMTPRLSALQLLCGTLTPLWATLQALVREHAGLLTRAERQLKVVRIQTTDTAERIVGVLWPAVLQTPLHERLAIIRAAKASSLAASASSAVGGRADPAGDQIDPKALERALKPKVSIRSFFTALPKPKSPATQGSTPEGREGGEALAVPGSSGAATPAVVQEDVIDLTSAEPTVRQVHKHTLAKRAGDSSGEGTAAAGGRDAKKPKSSGGVSGSQLRTVGISHFFKAKPP